MQLTIVHDNLWETARALSSNSIEYSPACERNIIFCSSELYGNEEFWAHVGIFDGFHVSKEYFVGNMLLKIAFGNWKWFNFQLSSVTSSSYGV